MYICTYLQVVMWDISDYEDRFQYNKPLKPSDTKGNIAAQVCKMCTSVCAELRTYVHTVCIYICIILFICTYVRTYIYRYHDWYNWII